MVQQGGLAIWGGLAGGFIAVIIFAKLRKISLGRLADTMVPGLLVAQIIGRFACIINGDAVGGATNLPWGFIYINPGSLVPVDLFGVPTHPYPVYEMLWNLAGLTLALSLRRYLKTDGLLFLSYLSFYAIGRFILTFVRQESVWLWGLQEAQVIAIAILIVSAGIMIYTFRRSKIDTTPEYLKRSVIK
jgi:phosphatidylglycerol:prolipoprotein diacylglycerol transferase